MKNFILLLLPFLVFASVEKLSVQEHNSIHGYNNKPTVNALDKSIIKKKKRK